MTPKRFHPQDIKAGLVVFLVAIPLCLGIALASGAPAFSGIIAGIVGGIVVGSISGSPLSVSGPAAGLTSIIITALGVLPSFEVFLAAVVIAGLIQLLFGALRLGIFAGFIPSSVIMGMLAAIGLILIMKQIPHAVGFDKDFEGDESFLQADGHNTFSELYYAFANPNFGAVLICLIGIGILLLWDTRFFKTNRILSLIPSALLVVFAGVGLNMFFASSFPDWEMKGDHLVTLPKINSMDSLVAEIRIPDFHTAINLPIVWVTAITLALVASIETLLSIEAADRLDPWNRTTPPNQELVAQGVGNIFSGMLGGLPVTAVVVRSSANITAGARTKMAAITHGFFLLVSIMAIPSLLNLIPKSALAAILLMVGYKLTSFKIISKQLKKGMSQFLPFAITIVAILLSDLLIGILIGLVAGIYFVIKANFKSAIHLFRSGNNVLIKLNKDVSFLNKPEIRKKLNEVNDGELLLIDGTNATFIDRDVQEEILTFMEKAQNKNIKVELKNIIIQ
ncbi:MAG TPA: SulP family inorganic anion transporter [Flavobacteriales bacterium]|nr:SulP family inorganic anion transporter [Flavobacteriales bacterium]HRE95994.1 SulP family inorganic anion transporter [Flavobacteriales bacterium]HRJ38138.1 SulP family inorganic anion transporter [Flavobacteriales bacterium]